MDSTLDRPGGIKGSRLGPTVSLEGDIRAEEDLMISGRVKGNIEAPTGSVTITKNAEIQADIKAATVLIEGKARGNVIGLKRATLAATADLTGQLETSELHVAVGAVFRGKVDIIK